MSEATFEQLDRQLAYIGAAAKGVCRTATRAGAKVLADAESAAAPIAKKGRRVNGVWINPGGMNRSIGYSGLKASTGLIGAKAGLDVGKREPGAARGSHGHLYIQGTDRRYTGFTRVRSRGRLVDMKVKRGRSGIKHRGISPAHLPSFIKTASTSAEQSAMVVVQQKIVQGIERAMTRQGL